MCGIAGSFRGDADPADDGRDDPWAQSALERIEHRGPDATGILTWTSATHGHVRLSIIDPDERSNQPFVYRGVLLSYVGECWNYRELRERLEADDYEFETEGDTEVVAALLNYWISRDNPAGALEQMEGQFAFAVTESMTGRTWLARDRLGEVPLYVSEEEASLLGEAKIRWASERKAWASEASATRALAPGSIWALGTPHERRYWSPPSRVMAEGPSAEEVLEILRVAVRERLQADVQIAFLASGGLDSSLILKLAQDEGISPIAYTAEMSGVPNPDQEAAEQICEELGVELRPVVIGDMTGVWLRDTIRTIEIPMKAQVEIGWPCLALAQEISADGFRVVLSGEGADELFGGYGNLARKATSDRDWMEARRDSVEKMARGNCVRTNKTFMAHGVEARLPFLSRELVEAVLPAPLADCPAQKGLLKDAARLAGLPSWVIDQQKRTFQGAVGTLDAADALYEGAQIRAYNAEARSLFGQLPTG